MIELKPRRKKIQRRKDAPVIVPKKRRPMGRPDPARSARIRVITARTRAARAELDALIAGAPKMPEIDRLPVMVRDTTVKRRRKKGWKRWSGEYDKPEQDDESPEDVVAPRKRRPAMLPNGPRRPARNVLRERKPTRCSRCGETGHNTRTCHVTPSDAFNARR